MGETLGVMSESEEGREKECKRGEREIERGRGIASEGERDNVCVRDNVCERRSERGGAGRVRVRSGGIAYE